MNIENNWRPRTSRRPIKCSIQATYLASYASHLVRLARLLCNHGKPPHLDSFLEHMLPSRWGRTTLGNKMRVLKQRGSMLRSYGSLHGRWHLLLPRKPHNVQRRMDTQLLRDQYRDHALYYRSVASLLGDRVFGSSLSVGEFASQDTVPLTPCGDGTVCCGSLSSSDTAAACCQNVSSEYRVVWDGRLINGQPGGTSVTILRAFVRVATC